MINWIPLEELLLCPIRNGLTKPKAIRGKGVKMIAMGEIFSKARINNMDMDRVPVTDKELENCRIQEGDLLFARQSLVLEGAGKCSIVADVKEPTVFESHLIRVRIDATKANPYYVFYYFNSTHGRDSIGTIVEQVAAAGIRGSDLIKLKVPCPDVQTQNKIAEFLQRIDEKIELNTDINNNLLEQVMAYYRHMFVNGNNEQNRICRADEVFDISIGKTPPRKEFQWFSDDPKNIRWVSISDMGDCGVFISESSEYLTPEAVSKFNLVRIPSNTVLLSFKLTVGRIAITDGEMTTNEAIAHFKTDNDNTVEYLYCYLKSFNYGNLGSTSSIATAVNSKIIKAMPFVVPSDEKLNEFHDYASPFFAQMKAIQTENSKLASLRDSLLPRLMNGELDVSDVEV